MGSFGISEGNITERGKKEKKQTNKQTQNTQLTTTVSSEIAQKLMSTTSKWGLGRKAQTASLVLRLTTGPERPEDNLREL